MQGRAYLAPGEDAIGVVVLGVSGSGKTTVGKMLAPPLGATYLEGDDYHSSANIAKMRAGRPLDDTDRWPWLERIGHAVAEHMDQGRSVVAACSALRRAYREALCKGARRPLVFMHLTIDQAVLAARIQARRQHFMPVSLLESQLATLEPLGADELGAEIAETGTAQQTVAAAERWLRLRATGHLDGGHEKGRPSRPFAREHKWLDWTPSDETSDGGSAVD